MTVSESVFAMIKNKKFKLLYANVDSNIAKALLDIQEIKLKSTAGNQHIQNLKKNLGEIQQQFQDEIRYLEKYSEWDKFTIAFFGETNAGKSTIIESLRILFDEKSRMQAVENNKSALPEMEKNYQKQIETLIASLSESYGQYEQEVSKIETMMDSLSEHNFHYEQKTSKIAAEIAALAQISKHEHRTSKKIIAVVVALVLAVGFGTGFISSSLSRPASAVAHQSADALTASLPQPS